MRSAFRQAGTIYSQPGKEVNALMIKKMSALVLALALTVVFSGLGFAADATKEAAPAAAEASKAEPAKAEEGTKEAPKKHKKHVKHNKHKKVAENKDEAAAEKKEEAK